MNAGELNPEQIRVWVANRFCYQRSIPMKDAAIVSNCPIREVRRAWLHAGLPQPTGAILFRRECHFMVPGYLLEDVFDPTGAGDCFAGGFIPSAPVEEATSRSTDTDWRVKPAGTRWGTRRS